MSILEYVVSHIDDGTPPDFILESKLGRKWSCDAKDRATLTGKGTALREMLKEIQAAEKLTLGWGTFDTGLIYFQLPPCTIAGTDRLKTFLINHQEDQRHYCGFEQSRGSILQDLSIVWKPKDNQIRGGQTIGYANVTAPPLPITGANLRRVDVYSYGSVAWYFWGAGKFHKFYAEDTNFYAGRIGVEIGMASASDCIDVTMNGCGVYVNFGTYGGAGGDVGQRNIGVLVRGGSFTGNNCTINVDGYGGNGVAGDNNCDPFEMALGVACSSLGVQVKPGDQLPVWGNNEWPSATLNNPVISVTGKAKVLQDLNRYIGKMTVNGGRGGLPGGGFSYGGDLNYLTLTGGAKVT